MKYILSIAVLIFLSGCTHTSKGSKTWDRTTTLHNPAVEIIKAFKGTGSAPVQRYSSYTDKNMPQEWR